MWIEDREEIHRDPPGTVVQHESLYVIDHSCTLD